jgi:hypothetical protein
VYFKKILGRFVKMKRFLTVVIALTFITGAILWAQDVPPDLLEGTQGESWLRELDAATQDELSINVEEVQFAVDSFFDVFVETVLREGLPADIVDPELGTSLTSEEVTNILREQGPELFNTLGRVETPTFGPVTLAPGAAVYKWDREGRSSRGPHRFNLYTWARVNQWIRASMNKTKIAWNVFKPGVYSTDCMYLNVHSNGNMMLTLDNYGPLTGPAGTIPTAYALSTYISTPNDLVLYGRTMGGARPIINWVRDAENGTANVGPHRLVKVWNSINVRENVGPGLYTTPNGPSAVITVIAAGI